MKEWGIIVNVILEVNIRDYDIINIGKYYFLENAGGVGGKLDRCIGRRKA